MSAVASITDLLAMKARYPENAHFSASCSSLIADLQRPDVTRAVERLEVDLHRLSPLVKASVEAPCVPAWGSGWHVCVRLVGASGSGLTTWPRFDSEADALAFQAEANAAITRAT